MGRYAVNFATDLSDDLTKLADVLRLTGRDWVMTGLPADHYARSGPYVIADWSRIWRLDPTIPEDIRPIICGRGPIRHRPAALGAEYILNTIQYYERNLEQTRQYAQAKANATADLLTQSATRAADRRQKRTANRTQVRQRFVPLAPRVVENVRQALLREPRFATDNPKFVSNVLRNATTDTPVGIHLLLTRFRGRKVACICTPTDDRTKAALNQWQASGRSPRAVISDLPMPTEDLRSTATFLDALVAELDKIPVPTPATV